MIPKNLIRDCISKIIGYNNFTKINVLLKGGIRYIPMLGYSDINGWFTPKEAMALYDVTINLPNENPVVCEIGSWQGKSSIILAKGIIYKNNPKLYCIDPFDGVSDKRSMNNSLFIVHDINLRENFINNVKKNNVDKIISVLQGFSNEIVKDFNDSLDLLLIDGNHDYEAVLKDYMDWKRFLKVNGFIAFHDSTWSGPNKVIKEYIMYSSNWKIIKNVDDLIIAKKLCN